MIIINSYSVVPGCTADPNELNTGPNAASDPNCNEANATTGLYTIGTGSTLTSVTDSHDGTYALKGTCGGSNIQYIGFNFSVTNLDTFDVSFWCKTTQGSLVRLTNWTNLSGGPSSVTPTSTWTEYTYSVTATTTGTATLRFYAASNTSGVAGDNIFIDNLSLIDTT